MHLRSLLKTPWVSSMHWGCEQRCEKQLKYFVQVSYIFFLFQLYPFLMPWFNLLLLNYRTILAKNDIFYLAMISGRTPVPFGVNLNFATVFTGADSLMVRPFFLLTCWNFLLLTRYIRKIFFIKIQVNLSKNARNVFELSISVTWKLILRNFRIPRWKNQ